MRPLPSESIRNAALEAAAALRHAASLAELAAAGPDPDTATRYLRDGIRVALGHIKPTSSSP